MRPKIDYQLLGQALGEYEKRGYTYVEVPWTVTDQFLRATLPPENYAMTIGLPVINGKNPDELYPYRENACLVGSAEQGFLSLNLNEGAYVGVTPCFRLEPMLDIFHQEMFMKIELFVAGREDRTDRVMGDAKEVMSLFTKDIYSVATDEGADLMMGGVEIGSYGFRTFQNQSWTYGTGLALPRFSVAKAFASIT